MCTTHGVPLVCFSPACRKSVKFRLSPGLHGKLASSAVAQRRNQGARRPDTLLNWPFRPLPRPRGSRQFWERLQCRPTAWQGCRLPVFRLFSGGRPQRMRGHVGHVNRVTGSEAESVLRSCWLEPSGVDPGGEGADGCQVLGPESGGCMRRGGSSERRVRRRGACRAGGLRGYRGWWVPDRNGRND
jgi:hypothetical protein